jgi:hypothetical protein
MKPAYNAVMTEIKNTLPAHPGDLLWLMERFFFKTFPNGGKVDLISASIHSNLVYQQVVSFCGLAKYKHHPHWRTLLGFTNLTEMGINKRIIPAHTITLAARIICGSCTKKSKIVHLTVGNKKWSRSQPVLTISKHQAYGVIRQVQEPNLKRILKLMPMLQITMTRMMVTISKTLLSSGLTKDQTMMVPALVEQELILELSDPISYSAILFTHSPSKLATLIPGHSISQLPQLDAVPVPQIMIS